MAKPNKQIKSKKSKNKTTKNFKQTDAKFKVEKLKGTKDKRTRSITFAKHEKKKIQNQQFESIQNLNTRLDQIQNSIRNPSKDKFERMKSPQNKPVDIDAAINAINSL